MADSSADKPTLEVGIITVLTIIVNNALPEDQHTIYTTLVSPLGWGIGWGIRWLKRRHNFNQLMEKEQQWINERLVERDKPGVTARVKREIDADVAQRRAAMQALARQRYKIE